MISCYMSGLYLLSKQTFLIWKNTDSWPLSFFSFELITFTAGDLFCNYHKLTRSVIDMSRHSQLTTRKTFYSSELSKWRKIVINQWVTNIFAKFLLDRAMIKQVGKFGGFSARVDEAWWSLVCCWWQCSLHSTNKRILSHCGSILR